MFNLGIGIKRFLADAIVLVALLVTMVMWVTSAQTLAEQVARLRERDATQQEYIGQLQEAHIRDRLTIQEAATKNQAEMVKVLVESQSEKVKMLWWFVGTVGASAGGIWLYLVRTFRKIRQVTRHSMELLDALNTVHDGIHAATGKIDDLGNKVIQMESVISGMQATLAIVPCIKGTGLNGGGEKTGLEFTGPCPGV